MGECHARLQLGLGMYRRTARGMDARPVQVIGSRRIGRMRNRRHHDGRRSANVRRQRVGYKTGAGLPGDQLGSMAPVRQERYRLQIRLFKGRHPRHELARVSAGQRRARQAGKDCERDGLQRIEESRIRHEKVPNRGAPPGGLARCGLGRVQVFAIKGKLLDTRVQTSHCLGRDVHLRVGNHHRFLVDQEAAAMLRV